MSFTDLPHELILQVFDYVTPDEIVPLSLTCHHVYDHAGSQLARHKDLKSQFSTLEIPLTLPSTILLPFVDDLHMAAYPKRLIFACVHNGNQKMRCEFRKQIVDIARGSGLPFLDKLVVNDSDAVLSDAFMAVSIWMLPNVTSIEIDEGHHEHNALARGPLMLELLDGIDRSGKPALHNVFECSITKRPNPWQRIVPFDFFDNFDLLPRLEKVKAIGVCISNEVRGPSYRECSLKSLVLEGCIVCPHTLGQLLRCYKHLTSLEYSQECARTHGPCWCRRDRGIDHATPQKIIDVLQGHVKKRLESLVLRMAYIGGSNWTVPNLRAFSSLQTVTLSKKLLLRVDNVPFRLKDVLPRSIREVSITNWHEFHFREPKEGIDLLDGLPVPSKLPMLQRIFLGISYPHTEISLVPSAGLLDRELRKLKKDFLSHVKSYNPDFPQTIRFTISEYILWLRYRQRCPTISAAERVQYIGVGEA